MVEGAAPHNENVMVDELLEGIFDKGDGKITAMKNGTRKWTGERSDGQSGRRVKEKLRKHGKYRI